MWDFFLAGGPVMWPLLACSLLSLTVVLERAWFWAHLDLDGDRVKVAALFRTVAEGKVMAGPHASSSLVGKMLQAGLDCPAPQCGKAMEAVALDALHTMRRGMPVLDTIITVAPMLGILGTVLGIISSFDMLGQAGVEDPKSVVAGIAEALITTAAGLAISVATVFPYNFFNARIEQVQDMLESYGSRLELARGLGSSGNEVD